MAYRTPGDAAGTSGRSGPEDVSSVSGNLIYQAASGAPVMLPDGQFASDATYRQQGDDLVLTGPDGTTVTVEGYFLADPAPDLLTPEGGRMTPALVDSFTPPESAGQYAQAGQVAQAADAIGQVQDLSGQVFVVRADGTREQLAAGDAVFQGDVVETAAGGAVNLLFVDETTFALGADARLALDEMVFNPATQTGSSSFSVLKGVFVFVSGQIAQADNTQMTVTTPVATIGIRGTTVAGDVKPAGEESKFTVIDGEIAVVTQGGTVVMSEANATTVITSFLAPPSPPVVFTPQQLDSNYGSAKEVTRGYFNDSRDSSNGQEEAGTEEEDAAEEGLAGETDQPDENGEPGEDGDGGAEGESGDEEDLEDIDTAAGGEEGDGEGEGDDVEDPGDDAAGDAEVPEGPGDFASFGGLTEPLPSAISDPLPDGSPEPGAEAGAEPPPDAAPEEVVEEDDDVVEDVPEFIDGFLVTDFSAATGPSTFPDLENGLTNDGNDLIFGSAFNPHFPSKREKSLL